MPKFIKNIIITDTLDNELKHLTVNQIKIVLNALSLIDNSYTQSKSLFHRSKKRFLKAYQDILYLKPMIDQIRQIKNTVFDRTNPQVYKEQLLKLKKQLSFMTYYKIPIKVTEEIISSNLSKTELLFLLKFYSIFRMTYHKQYTYKIDDLIKSTFGDISRKEMCIKRKVLKELSSNIKVTSSNIKVTISNKLVTISNI